ncbi:MAG TPA: family 43 glycosylhydrolase, partial [Anseongella sp.]|nr:family 43 glycosylhydrolase [Anseongella sp.]
ERGEQEPNRKGAGLEAPAPEEGPAAANRFQNPVYGKDFPDPNLVKAPDGYFYAYSTQARRESGVQIIPIMRSRDLTSWEELGAALEKKPDWKAEGGIWAPDAAYYKGLYRLYYSYSTWGDPNPGIGLAVSKQPEGPFRDLGKMFLSKEIGVDNSIDAFFMEDGGKPYLFWGSFHGIYGVELSEDGNKVKGEKFRIAGDAYEGTYILKKGDYYYYFGSTGTCCEGASSTYKVKVGRASSLKGPYLDRDGNPLLENAGTLLLEGNEAYAGPGHNGDIFSDDRGQDWMLYHAYDKKDPDKGRVMLLDRISWKDGWPEIAGQQPGLDMQAGPEFRNQ